MVFGVKLKNFYCPFLKIPKYLFGFFILILLFVHGLVCRIWRRRKKNLSMTMWYHLCGGEVEKCRQDWSYEKWVEKRTYNWLTLRFGVLRGMGPTNGNILFSVLIDWDWRHWWDIYYQKDNDNLFIFWLKNNPNFFFFFFSK